LAQVKDSGMSVAGLPAPQRNAASGEDYAAWLGVTQDEDARESTAALAGERPDWVVVDHYGLDADWERVLRPHTRHLMVIDDLANRPHECDLLLDQNFSSGTNERYAGLVPPDCRLLLGPRYALLRPEYAAHRSREPRRHGSVETVFVYFGGSDPHNLTGVALEALSRRSLRHLKVDIVVGVSNTHGSQLRKLAAARPGTVIYRSRPHLADLMSRADLAIGAAGTTTWERMCLGIPSLVVSTAENQRPAAVALAEHGLIQYLGSAQDVGSAELAAAIEKTINGVHLADQSLRARLTVDGLGAMRVAECIDPTNRRQLRLRAAQIEDAELYFAWVNDPQVRRQSLKTDAIPWRAHELWFRSKLDDERSRLFVLEAKSLPVGQIRFDFEGGEARIDYSLDATFRGRGWGACLIAMGLRRICERERMVFRADVKATNAPSAAVFSRLGFSESSSSDGSGLMIFRFDSHLQTLPEID
jgi:UDP-2,4-diacetamido-2,4,6-trideoxy-beta-L-altropyranose hydrolase